MDIKYWRILLGSLFLICLFFIWYYDDGKDLPEDTVDIIESNENVLDSVIRSGNEWYSVPVTKCEKVFENQYHLSFENGLTILTNKPAKIGDTTRCWINNWYQSRVDNSIDSIVFERPY